MKHTVEHFDINIHEGTPARWGHLALQVEPPNARGSCPRAGRCAIHIKVQGMAMASAGPSQPALPSCGLDPDQTTSSFDTGAGSSESKASLDVLDVQGQQPSNSGSTNAPQELSSLWAAPAALELPRETFITKI